MKAKRGVVTLGLLLLALVHPLPSSAQAPGYLPGASDTILHRTLIPSQRHAHGELRLVGRPDATAVQTVLCSPALVRGLRAIGKKERSRWPAKEPGHEDSQLFLRSLERAQELALQEFHERQDGADSRRKLLIEISITTVSARVSFFGIDVEAKDGQLNITGSRLFLAEEVSLLYARRAMRLQLAAGFHLSDEIVDQWLASSR